MASHTHTVTPVSHMRSSSVNSCGESNRSSANSRHPWASQWSRSHPPLSMDRSRELMRFDMVVVVARCIGIFMVSYTSCLVNEFNEQWWQYRCPLGFNFPSGHLRDTTYRPTAANRDAMSSSAPYGADAESLFVVSGMMIPTESSTEPFTGMTIVALTPWGSA